MLLFTSSQPLQLPTTCPDGRSPPCWTRWRLAEATHPCRPLSMDIGGPHPEGKGALIPSGKRQRAASAHDEHDSRQRLARAPIPPKWSLPANRTLYQAAREDRIKNLCRAEWLFKQSWIERCGNLSFPSPSAFSQQICERCENASSLL